ncbi:MAG: hypothetical protein ACYCZB_13815 [Acidiphilium sp.]
MKVAFHALRPEIEAGLSAQKPVIMIYDELKDRIPSGYEWFRQYVAREITGKAGSRGGRVAGKRPLPHKAPVLDQPTASPLSNRQSALSPENQEQSNRSPSQLVERPKRIVTRVPDIERLVFGAKGRPKE